MNELAVTIVDKVRQAAEPVFSIVDEQAYQSFGEVFQSGLDDPALLNAVMLTFAFASTNGIIDRECLGYQSNAISCIRKRMNSPHLATSASTIGAILLLAGVEVRQPVFQKLPHFLSRDLQSTNVYGLGSP